MKNDKSFIGRLFPIIILFSLYTLFQGWIPHWGLVILASLGIGCVVLLFGQSKHSFSTPFFVLYLCFVFFILLNIFIGDDYWCKKSFFQLTSVLLMMLDSLLALRFYLSPQQKTNGRRLINMVFIIIVLSTIATAILSIAIPQVIRFAMMDENQEELLHQLYRSGMSNYYLPHAIPVIVPALVLYLKNGVTKGKRLVVIFILLASISLVYFSGAMTALLLTVLALFGSFLISFVKKRNHILGIILLFAIFSPILFNQDLLLKSLESIEKNIGEDNFFYDKIIDFENSLSGYDNTGDIDVRSSLYEDSWNGFLSNPLFGTDAELGGHSTNLDFLASMGIIGFIPYSLLLLYVFIWTKKRLPQMSVPYYAIGYFLGFIMLCIKSMNTMEMWFFLFALLPILMKDASSSCIILRPRRGLENHSASGG